MVNLILSSFLSSGGLAHLQFSWDRGNICHLSSWWSSHGEVIFDSWLKKAFLAGISFSCYLHLSNFFQIVYWNYSEILLQLRTLLYCWPRLFYPSSTYVNDNIYKATTWITLLYLFHFICFLLCRCIVSWDKACVVLCKSLKSKNMWKNCNFIISMEGKKRVSQ